MALFLRGTLVWLFLDRTRSYGLHTHASQQIRQRGSCRNAVNSAVVDEDPPWLRHGLLISSFSDGLLPNTRAHEFLLRGLYKSILKEEQAHLEQSIRESALQSPCCGPNMAAMEGLARVDMALQSFASNDDEFHPQQILPSMFRRMVRVVYIPTAMYALRSESTNSPGKQRQRARADAKKRRDNIISLLKQILGDEFQVVAVTVDWDDGSVKHPEGVALANSFPTDGKIAMTEWEPHLIYVEGGNTFWLHYCMEKGWWAHDLMAACAGQQSRAVYCGSSAGAILVGKYLETACWKGWDDPSVVPGKENVQNWIRAPGLGLVGSLSFFPHMEPQWQETVDEREKLLDGTVLGLSDDLVCCVDGDKGTILTYRSTTVFGSCEG